MNAWIPIGAIKTQSVPTQTVGLTVHATTAMTGMEQFVQVSKVYVFTLVVNYMPILIFIKRNWLEENNIKSVKCVYKT